MRDSTTIRVSTVAELLQALEQSRGATEAEIILAAGEYFLAAPLALDAEYRNITLRGEGNVRLIGGVRPNRWALVQDPATLARLAPEARAHVRECDLTEAGILESGELVSRGFGREPHASHAEVFWNGKPMYLSQYPKRGEHLTITGFVKGKMNELEEMAGEKEHGFYYDDDRPATWAESNDLWVHGYWSFDWAASYERVDKLDPAARLVTNHPPYANYPFRLGQRFYFLNILEEVRNPGDFYIDRETRKLYFYPETENARQTDDELLVSALEAPMISLHGCRAVTIAGIAFECTRGIAVKASDTDDLLIDNCLFRHIGNTAIVLEGGFRNRVCNSTIHDCGDGGIILFGGDRRSLVPAESEVTNNHIYRIGQWSRCYYPAIHLRGVGIRATHNLLHDLPHFGVWYWGNDIVIRDNEIYSVCLETGDAGAIYAGRDLSCRGNEISHNFIHHMGGVGIGTMGIYNDDGLSGTVMEDNFFLEVGRAAFVGGGVDHVIRNNVFVKCAPAMTLDSRGSHTKFFWGKMYDTLRKTFYQAAPSWRSDWREKPGEDAPIDASQSPYMDRYPELRKIDEMFKGNHPMNGSAHIVGNVICAKAWFRYYYDMRDENKKVMYDGDTPIELSSKELSAILDSRKDVAMEWSAGKGSWLFEQNYTAMPADFEDAAWGNIAVREGSEAYEYGYERRELNTIGLVENHRSVNPIKVLTSLSYALHGDRTVTLAVRNTSDQQAKGVIEFSQSGHATLPLAPITFSLAPGQTLERQIAAIAHDEPFVIEARSDLPGVRPSRVSELG